MDTFTLAVIIADLAMGAAFVALIVLDKGPKAPRIEPVKSTGKRPA